MMSKERKMLTLYEFPMSGNCHKVRLLLSLLGLQYSSIVLDRESQEQKSPDFILKNPYGQVPVLQDDELVIRDSQAILVYLAKRYGDANWLPDDAAELAQVMGWLSTAANEVTRGPNALRLLHKFGRVINESEAQQITNSLLTLMQMRLSQHDWLALEHISIADIAMYPYIALAGEGGMQVDDYPSVTDWLSRIQALSGYVGMPGMWSATLGKE
jgi:glutathione S-transferase